MVVLAALLRVPGIDARGQFDADQGHDMLTLTAWVRDGIVPLLGPRASVGTFHHGGFYYFLLAPVAVISQADPVAIAAFIALLGIGTVALTWWVARQIGGLTAAALAGLLMAVSPAAIGESTVIWNPSPIAFFAILAIAAAWRARSGARRSWWAVAVGAAGAVVQLHLLGIVFFVGMLVIVLAEIRHDRSIVPHLVAGLAIVGVLFLPLLVHELTTGFLETHRFLSFLEGSKEPITNSLPVAMGITLLRVVGWPFVGIVTDAPLAAVLVLMLTLSCAVLAIRLVAPPGRTAVSWLVGLLVWSIPALTFAAPSLQVVVLGLPNDHYHAFLDPVVVLLVTVPLAILLDRAVVAWRSMRGTQPRASSQARAAMISGATAGAIVIAVFAIAISRIPPSRDPNGGWPAMRDAGERVVGTDRGTPIHLIGLPIIKPADAVTYPIEAAGGQLTVGTEVASDPVLATGKVVIACDRLFEPAIRATCGGPAEDRTIAAWAAASGIDFELIDRFDASPRTAISIYAPAAP